MCRYAADEDYRRSYPRYTSRFLEGRGGASAEPVSRTANEQMKNTYQSCKRTNIRTANEHNQLNPVHRFRANMVHVRQSRPDSGRGFEITVLKTYQAVPALLASGAANEEQSGLGRL